MNKYDVKFCSCGRIHFTDMAAELEVLNRGEDVILVCKHCGASTRIWFDDMFDGKCWCSNTVPDGVVDLTEIGMLVMSRGQSVYMSDGSEATGYHSGIFLAHPESLDCNVDTKRLIRDIADEDKLGAVSAYVSGINWAGTKYDILNTMK